jgi:hypothetical protein
VVHAAQFTRQLFISTLKKKVLSPSIHAAYFLFRNFQYNNCRAIQKWILPNLPAAKNLYYAR